MASGTPAAATIGFGASFTDEATAVITGLTDMTVDAHIECFMQANDSTASNNAVFHDAVIFCMKSLQPESVVAGTGFTARMRLEHGFAKDDFKFHYIYKV